MIYLGKKIFNSFNSRTVNLKQFDKGLYLLKISSGYNHNLNYLLKTNCFLVYLQFCNFKQTN